MKLILHILEELVFRTLVRGRESGDARLLILLGQIEICVSKAQNFMDDLEILSKIGQEI